MWREHIEALTSDAVFAEPVAEAAIREAEQSLGRRLPQDLIGLLTETDGVIVGPWETPLIWPLARILSDNLAMRADAAFAEIYMPFDALLFFADAGNGDLFAFPRTARDDVFVWNHEDDSRAWCASSLSSFLQRWLDGTLTV